MISFINDIWEECKIRKNLIIASLLAVIALAFIAVISPQVSVNARNVSGINSNGAETPAIDVTINLTAVKEAAKASDSFSEIYYFANTTAVSGDNITLSHTVLAERDGGMLWLACISKIGSTDPVMHYNWTRSFDDAAISYLGRVDKGAVSEEYFGIAFIDIYGETANNSINCTVTVQNIATGETVSQSLRLNIS
jgi:hypothetical protein